MALRRPDFSLPCYYLERGYWCPTLDMSNFVTVGSNSCADVDIILHEEALHRFLFIGTETRLWMTWMEFLSNYEFISWIVEAAKLQHKMKDIRFHVPLGLDMNNRKLPIDLKNKIVDLLAACSTISLLHETCEPILEAATLDILVRRFKSKINEIACKKIKHYELEAIYPKVVKSHENFKEHFISILEYYVFSFLADSRRAHFPPLLLSSSYEDFNQENCNQITERFSTALNSLGQVSFDKEKLAKFYAQHIKQFAYPCKVSAQLEAARSALDDLPKNKQLIKDPESLIYSISIPVFTSANFMDEALSDELERAGFEPVVGAGLPPIYTMENLQSNKEVIQEFTNLKTRRHIATSAMYQAYGVTALKYFFLTGRWTNLMQSVGTDKELLEEILDLLRFEVVE